MKYIRIENGIYEFDETRTSEFENILPVKPKNKEPDIIGINIDNILAQADTIEELCDEFIHEYQTDITGVLRTVRARHLRADVSNAYKTDMAKGVIYGVIWIKGENGEPILKSVAKMNEKGELELI